MRLMKGVKLSLISISWIAALFAVASFVYFCFYLGNRLMFIGDDWCEIFYYVGLFNGKYSLSDIFQRAESRVLHQQVVTRILTLLDIKYGDGTVIFAMLRAVFLQIGSALLLICGIFKIKDQDLDLQNKLFFGAIVICLFTSPYWLSHVFIAQHHGWLLSIFFGLLSIFFLARIEKDSEVKNPLLWILLTLLSSVFCLYSWGNGLVIFPVLFLLTYKAQIYKKLGWRLVIIILFVIIVVLGIYIKNLPALGGNGESFFKQPIFTFYYFLQLVGDPVSSEFGRKSGAAIGAIILLTSLFVVHKYIFIRKKLDEAQIILLGGLLFFMSSLACTAIGRVSWLEGEGGLPPLRFTGVALALESSLIALLFLEVKIYTKSKIIEIFVMSLSFALVCSLRCGQWTFDNNMYNQSDYNAVSRNISYAINGANYDSVFTRIDFKEFIPPLIPEIEKYEIGPSKWHEKKWLGLYVGRDLKIVDDCSGYVTKIEKYNGENFLSFGFEGHLESNYIPDLVVATNDKNRITGLALVVTPYRNLQEYLLRKRLNKIPKAEFFGSYLKDGDGSLILWGVNKDSRSACKIKEISY